MNQPNTSTFKPVDQVVLLPRMEVLLKDFLTAVRNFRKKIQTKVSCTGQVISQKSNGNLEK